MCLGRKYSAQAYIICVQPMSYMLEYNILGYALYSVICRLQAVTACRVCVSECLCYSYACACVCLWGRTNMCMTDRNLSGLCLRVNYALYSPTLSQTKPVLVLASGSY